MNDILKYNKALNKDQIAICELLQELIVKQIPKAEGKVWHGHPVWFLDGNPIVGYSIKKAGVEILFWSGQSFETPGLVASGKFKAAGMVFQEISEVKKTLLKRLLKESKSIQWDYANLVKKKKLDRLF
ncbi:MAG: hypothetical protein RLZZ330_347 [Actinomycetota bacterium]